MTNGNLPNGWQWVHLGEICEVNPRRRTGLTRSPDAATSFVPMAAIDEKSGTITGAEIRAFDEVRKGYTYFEENDVLFAKITPCMQNGKHAIAVDLIDGIGFGTTEFHVLHPNDRVIAEWLHLFVRQPSVLELATTYFTGSVGQQRVPKEFLEALDIPLPPIPEQRRIAGIIKEQMAAVDEARKAAEAQLKAAEALAAAYLREVFESEEAREWPTVKVGEFANVSGGIQKQPSRTPIDYFKPYLTVRNVQRGWIDFSQIEQFELSPDELTRYRLEEGDILIVEGNGSIDQIGRSAIFQGEIEDCVHQNHLIRVRVDQTRCIPEYVSRFLNSDIGKAQMVDRARTSSGLYTLSVSKVKSLEVRLPSLHDQRRLVASLSQQLDEVREILTSLQEQLTLTNELPAALLRQAFNGEL